MVHLRPKNIELKSDLRVLGLCSYPELSASTRFRAAQFVDPLKKNGITLDIHPFLSESMFKQLYSNSSLMSKLINSTLSSLSRLALVTKLNKYDAIFIQREAMPFGPAIFETLYRSLGNLPIILDLDDATYIKYESPTYGKIGTMLKFFSKTDKLIDRSSCVICGNEFIAEYVNGRGKESVILPTIVNGDVFSPSSHHNDIPVLGWIGTHSTYPSLKSLFPMLNKLSKKHKFILRIVGGPENIDRSVIPDLNIDNRQWNLEREVEDFQTLDIGLYPIFESSSANSQWISSKSGFKAIEYMAVGIPFVCSPVGIIADLGIENETHFNAVSDDDWYHYLDILLSDPGLRKDMGRMGRNYFKENFDLFRQSEVIAALFRKIINENSSS